MEEVHCEEDPELGIGDGVPALATDTLVWRGRPLTQKAQEKGSGDQPGTIPQEFRGTVL